MNANTPLTRETTGYPTQKPEALLERIVRAASSPESRVLDPMCGSGTTLAVAARLGRYCVGIDLSPLACQIARARLQAILGYTEAHPSSGGTSGEASGQSGEEAEEADARLQPVRRANRAV
jgi:adenine specific DNA methylase Mod